MATRKDLLYKALGVNTFRVKQSKADKQPEVSMNYYDRLNAYVDSMRVRGEDVNTLYNLYDQMDASSSDASNMLDIVSEEATMKNKDNELVIWFTAENKTLEARLNTMIDRLGLNKHATEYCRYIAKYGRFVVRPFFVKEGKNMMIGWIDDHVNSTIDERYKYYRRVLQKFSDNGAWVGFEVDDDSQDYEYWDFIEFKIGPTIMGRSLLAGAVERWKSLDLLEKSLEMYRLSKPPLLTTYNVPVSTNDPLEIMNTIKLYKRFIERSVSKTMLNTSGITSEINQSKVPSPLESLFIPIRKDGNQGGVEVLETNVDVSNIADVEYFRNKYISTLYSLVSPDSLTDISDPSKNVSMSSFRILRKVELVQTAYMEGVDRLAQIELALSGLTTKEGTFEVNMTSSSDLLETIKIEKYQLALDVTEQFVSLAGILFGDVEQEKIKTWTEFIIKDFLSLYFGDMLDRYEQFEADKKEEKEAEKAAKAKKDEKEKEKDKQMPQKMVSVSEGVITYASKKVGIFGRGLMKTKTSILEDIKHEIEELKTQEKNKDLIEEK